MRIVPNDARWQQLQAQIAQQIPDAEWKLRQLDSGVANSSGESFVQVVVERVMPGRSGDEVLGVGSTADAAVRDAIQVARQYPAPRM
jgi:predicted regulator of amino acid metabolism with ACT domain